ncbi:hypothetical protein KV708_08550 [Comamonas thiooxydans]|uniref:hypothetical protein n=1 Tax=Comamonas thiooxydans TaxID=363952 RepID=UPI000AA738BE|nr:hypothetical protein [Comamonas thiooxydans]
MNNSTLLFGVTGASLFNQRVVSRPTTSTVFVERPTRDPLAARLEESLKRAVEMQRRHLHEQQQPAPVNLNEPELTTL